MINVIKTALDGVLIIELDKISKGNLSTEIDA